MAFFLWRKFEKPYLIKNTCGQKKNVIPFLSSPARYAENANKALKSRFMPRQKQGSLY